jgi:uncharacterized protein (DUF362 family)
MKINEVTGLGRREFLKKGAITVGALTAVPVISPLDEIFKAPKQVVSIVKIKDDRIDYAVEQAIDQLGGISNVTRKCNKIMLKPNLTVDDPNCTTKPVVIRTLAQLMKKAGKEVCIGEGSAVGVGINATDGNNIFFTRNPELLDKIQKQVFDKLGYSQLASELDIPLINLHTGDMVDVEIPDAHCFKKLTIHKSLRDIDMLCSVPMMKTHVLARVTLGLKNVIGLYPGSAYCAVRSCVHTQADNAGSPSIAFEILDMAKANKMGLTVIDGSMAMEGDGPSNGKLVKMDLIIAGTNPLAADMVAASIMGFEHTEIPQFVLAHQSGMSPSSLEEIEIRGETIEAVKRNFIRPTNITWRSIKDVWGVKEI